MERYIEYVIDDIGCPKHLKGYNALYECVRYQFENRGARICETYSAVAEKLGHTYGQVERNVRHLIQWLLINGDMDKIHNYFGASLPNNMKLTNAQFIITLAVAAYRTKRGEENVNNGR